MADGDAPTPEKGDLERMADRGLRIARIMGKKLTRKIEETFPSTKGTDWKKVAKYAAVGAGVVLVGGALLEDGAGELAEGAAGGESAMSGYGTTGVAVNDGGILCSDGTTVA